MSGFENARSISLQCGGADIRQYRFVVAAAGGIAEADTAGVDCIGVALEAYDDSEYDAGNASNVIPVALLDGAKLMVVAGDAVTKGAAIGTDNQGRAVAVTGATDHVLGYANEAAAAAGEQFQIVAARGGFAAQS